MCYAKSEHSYYTPFFEFIKSCAKESAWRLLLLSINRESVGKRAVVSKFRRLLHAAPYFDKLTATGLKTDQLYSVCSRQYFHELSNSNYAGSVNEDIDTDTKEFLKKHPNLVLSEQYYTASGAALKEGICLDPLYLGTGNNKKIRIPLDYGSDMYLIEEK